MEKETHWLKKSGSPLHYKAGILRGSGDLEGRWKHLGFGFCAAPTYNDSIITSYVCINQTSSQGLLLRASVIILPAIFWRPVFMLEII
eukprot:1146138-Pelagomonas_calceolata.AAC.1